MKHPRRLLAALLVLATSSASGSEPPTRTVEHFYAWAIRPSLADRGRGLAPARQFLGQELFAALELQRAYEKACSRLVPPDVKPYMLDQSPFFLWPDKAKSLQSAKATIKGDTALILAELSYDDLRWTDTVVLRRVDSHWAIVNIEWQEGGSLTKRLVEFASHRCAP
jgi:hypothetical protein